MSSLNGDPGNLRLGCDWRAPAPDHVRGGREHVARVESEDG